MSAWDGQPIYDRLPGINEAYRRDQDSGYYDPSTDVALWLTAPWDSLLIESRGKVDNFYADYLDPMTARSDALDWLAQFAGFTGDYWSSGWAIGVKRQLIADSYTFIWVNKGSRMVLEYMFGLFSLNVQVYLLGEFLAGLTLLPGTLGGEAYQYYLLVSLDYLRTSAEWQQIELLNRLYGPVFCESRVCYDRFYAGFSVCGDPTFDVTAPLV